MKAHDKRMAVIDQVTAEQADWWRAKVALGHESHDVCNCFFNVLAGGAVLVPGTNTYNYWTKMLERRFKTY